MEPGSLWAGSHGEKASIPTTKIELAGFGIGKLLSAEHDLYDRESPFPVPTWNASLRGASIKSSSKDAGTNRHERVNLTWKAFGSTLTAWIKTGKGQTV